MTIRRMLREVHFVGGAGHIAHLAALCPACGFEHSFSVDLEGHGRHTGNDVWTFDGDYGNPTFSPSMLSNRDKVDEHHPLCHSFLEDGAWRFLGDCSHEMAGQSVPMIPPEPDATFERRHGWHLYPWTDDEGKPLPLKPELQLMGDNDGDQG